LELGDFDYAKILEIVRLLSLTEDAFGKNLERNSLTHQKLIGKKYPKRLWVKN